MHDPRHRLLGRLALRTLVVLLLGSTLAAAVAAAERDDFIDPGDKFRRSTGTWKGLYAFENVHVVAMVEGEKVLQRRQTVIVEDGVIVQIGKARDVAIPENATVIDGRRRFLVPGLIDSHVHIWMAAGYFPSFDEKDLWTLFLANGITTVNEMIGADPENRPRVVLFDWRDDVARGRVVGPTLFVASPRFRDDLQRNFAEIDAAVRQYKDLGYDMIKVHAPNSLPNYLRLFEQAEALGIRPVGHPPFRSPDVPVETVLEHQTMVSHTQLLMIQYLRGGNLTTMTPAQRDDLARMTAAAGTVVQPTPATNRILYLYKVDAYWNQLIQSEWLRYFPPQLVAAEIDHNDARENNGTAADWKGVWDAIVDQNRRMVEAGVPFIAGSDSGGWDLTPHGFFFHEELDSLRNDFGLSGSEVLASATRRNAEFLEQGDTIGTIEVGKRADLVLVDRNPIAKTENLKRIAGVMVRGKWLPWSRLQAALDELAERMASPQAQSAVAIPFHDEVECHGGMVDTTHFGRELGGGL